MTCASDNRSSAARLTRAARAACTPACASASIACADATRASNSSASIRTSGWPAWTVWLSRTNTAATRPRTLGATEVASAPTYASSVVCDVAGAVIQRTPATATAIATPDAIHVRRDGHGKRRFVSVACITGSLVVASIIQPHLPSLNDVYNIMIVMQQGVTR